MSGRGTPAGPPGKDVLDGCRRCDLWRRATQGVPGAGPRRPRLMLVGEQPGDEEDREGMAFVGPAGRLLDELLRDAGLSRRGVYVTNAVKHFKWEPRGKRRLHKKPSIAEVNACNPWLAEEIAARKPQVILALGATAARAVLGRTVAVGAARGQSFAHEGGAKVRVTWHPSAVLRARYAGDDAALREGLVADLRAAARLAGGGD